MHTSCCKPRIRIRVDVAHVAFAPKCITHRVLWRDMALVLANICDQGGGGPRLPLPYRPHAGFAFCAG